MGICKKSHEVPAATALRFCGKTMRVMEWVITDEQISNLGVQVS